MPPIKRLRTRIILLLLGLLAVVLAAVFAAVYSSTSNSAQRQAQQQLQVGAKVFQRILDLKARELTTATQVLVADFGFREAVATGDLPTIGSALRNQAERIGADQALLLDDQGQVRVAARRDGPAGTVNLQALAQYADDVLLAVIDGEPYLLVSAVVRAPVPIGQVAMAFALDEALASEMKTLTGLDVGFATLAGSRLVRSAATLDRFDRAVGLAATGSSRVIADTEYLAVQILLLDDTGYQVTVELLSPLDEVLRVFDQLKGELVLITLLALLLSSFAAVMLAASFSRPVTALADAARRIGQGDYEGSLTLSRSDELGTLATSLDQMRRGIAEREQLILHNAFHDPLTGLANLNNLRERLATALQAGGQGSLALIGAVNAEQLVGTDGQGRYEEVIQLLARRLQSELPRAAFPAFQPGMGFLLMLDGADPDRAMMQVDGVLALLSQPVELDGVRLDVQWTAGLVAWPGEADGADELLRQATIARADAGPGRDRVAVYQANADQAHLRRMRIIRDLPHAAGNGELALVYQPKLDLHSGLVTQVEALLRWTHPQLGPVRPDEFIVLAEQAGSIHLLTQWVLEETAAQIARWVQGGIRLQVAMNLSARDLLDPTLAGSVARILAQRGVAASQLAIEITESALMEDPATSLLHLQRLGALGISLAVDDYGSGYSSLAMLKRLPVQHLKIDKAFVLNLATDEQDATIVRSTIELAHSLGLKVVAEGIEDQHSLDWLVAQGCDVGQGYHISRPLAADALQDWLVKRGALCGEAS